MAMAREVLVGKDGRASGVSFIDKSTLTEKRVSARSVILGASACESARLLLNSRSSLFPQGLANSSGAVGRYLMETTATTVVGTFPELARIPPHNHDGTGSVHVYMPWWRQGKKNGFDGGYHIEVFGGLAMPKPGMFRSVADRNEGYGAKLKEQCREAYGTNVQLMGRGEMVPNAGSRCEIDPNVIDRWGIPTLRFHLKWSDNEIRMAADMNARFQEIIEAAGGTPTSGRAHPEYGYLAAGGVAHEVGTVRMGSDPRTSVLNGFCQAHDVKNLFVTDAGCFTTSPDKNPTLNILALSWRASEHLIAQSNRGEL